MIIECAKIVLDYEYARTRKERVDHNEIIKFVATCVIQPYCWVKSSQATLEFLAFHLRFCINFQKEFYIGLDCVCVFFLYSIEKLRPDHNPDVPI
jgi:hypothetical protein